MSNLDIMVDIETFATDTNAAIVSIGAVAFNAGGDNAALWTNSPGQLLVDGQGFRVNVDLGKSDPDKRGNVDPATVEWWLQQSDDARAMLVSGDRLPLGEALQEFGQWLRMQAVKLPGPAKLTLWSNGPTFDEMILRAAFGRYGMDFPISFRGSRCCRTMFALATDFGWNGKEAAAAAPDDIVKHDALSDAVFQARGVASMQHFLRLTANVAGQGSVSD